MKSLLNALQEGRLVELPDSDKEKALLYLAHLIEAIPDVNVSVDLVDAMLSRERQANTALGKGIACPHVRAPSGADLLCAVGWSPAGIDYGAPDGKRVHLLFMYYIPDAQKNVYLKEVSSLAAAMSREGDIAPIAKAEDIGAVRERLLDWVAAALEAGMPESKARMIRLEARQAAAEAAPGAPAPAPLGAGAVQVLPVRVVVADGRALVLCPSAELTAALEAAPAPLQGLRPGGQIEASGFKIVCQSALQYGPRSLLECIAVKTV